ncbi:chromosome segregation protein [Calidifontibacillus erzurumensis]|uniref:Chromosome segregation protein n=1 Tax=Calidifontibacillus erzurumensis TaxID=2741433 RepID=A0A8J8KEW6_9BACI|nr:chromosome segregation protein [Calidifontibacillus erzurumensis]NSL52255.1 chromosome segregation protein [Calidifontibacillus erzurumensis]
MKSGVLNATNFEAWEQRFEQLLSKLNEIELQLSQKADDIVSIQVLHHRNELEEFEKRLDEIERKMDKIAQIDQPNKTEAIESYKLQNRPLMNKVAGFSTY